MLTVCFNNKVRLLNMRVPCNRGDTARTVKSHRQSSVIFRCEIRFRMIRLQPLDQPSQIGTNIPRISV